MLEPNSDEIEFDDEPAVLVPVETVLRPSESGGKAAGTAVPSPVQGQTQQLPDSVPVGQLPGGGEQKQPKKKSNGEPEQIALINMPEWWEEHWKGMPDFKQEDLMPWKTIFVHFENREDMEKFCAVVGQQVNLNTKSIWFPEARIDEVAKLRWFADPKPKSTKKEELEEILDGE